jgi:hypothetical protein
MIFQILLVITVDAKRNSSSCLYNFAELIRRLYQ